MSDERKTLDNSLNQHQDGESSFADDLKSSLAEIADELKKLGQRISDNVDRESLEKIGVNVKEAAANASEVVKRTTQNVSELVAEERLQCAIREIRAHALKTGKTVEKIFAEFDAAEQRKALDRYTARVAQTAEDIKASVAEASESLKQSLEQYDSPDDEDFYAENTFGG